MDSNPSPNRFNWPLATTLIVLALAGLGTLVAIRAMDFFKPRIVVNERVVTTTAIHELRKNAKLVVLSAKVGAFVEAENEKEYAVLGMNISFGKSKVMLRSTQNRVQFVIPLDSINTNRFEFDKQANELTVVLPHPVVDRDLVEEEPFPEIRTEVGWLRMDSRSGENLRKVARIRAREAVIEEAMNPVYLGAARDAGRDAAMKLLQPAIARIPGGIHLKIEFEDPPKVALQ